MIPCSTSTCHQGAILLHPSEKSFGHGRSAPGRGPAHTCGKWLVARSFLDRVPERTKAAPGNARAGSSYRARLAASECEVTLTEKRDAKKTHVESSCPQMNGLCRPAWTELLRAEVRHACRTNHSHLTRLPKDNFWRRHFDTHGFRCISSPNSAARSPRVDRSARPCSTVSGVVGDGLSGHQR
jgi:hypothetical protein